MRVNFSHFLVLSVVFLVQASQVYAGQELLVRKEVDVYAEKSTESQILRTLEKGDRVPLSPKKYGEWRKVLLKSGASSRAGWVKSSDLEGSITVAGDSPADRGKGNGTSTGFARRSFIGLSIVSTMARQGARAITREDGTTENVSTLEGFSIFPFVFYDGSLGATTGFRVYGGLRSLLMSGTLSRGGSTPVEISQSMYSVGGLMRFYSSPKSAFWYGGGLEVARAYKVKVIYANKEEAGISEADYPTYALVRAGAGYHLAISPDWIMNLETFLNFIPNSKPMTYAGEVLLSVAMGF